MRKPRPKIGRLRTLAKALRALPPEQFNIDLWDCGTTACALGHACRINAFKEAGLINWGMPQFGDFYGFEAGASFFGIDIEEARKLFLPYRYRRRNETFFNPTAKQVARRIERIIQKAQRKVKA